MIQIAHRGYSNLCKDNSKEAFVCAMDANFDMIELDIQLSKDNVLFIYHDTFYESFLLKDLFFSEIYNLDNDILTLDQFFYLIDTTKVKVYLDIKGNDVKICQYLHQFLEKKCISNIYIASFNISVIEKLSELSSNYKLGIITENVYPMTFLHELCSQYNLHFFSFHWEVLTEKIIQELHDKQIIVYTYTCKDKNILSFIQKFQVDGIVTNFKIIDLMK
jgi:glycerophosphoryl diester phosphodiesterase